MLTFLITILVGESVEIQRGIIFFRIFILHPLFFLYFIPVMPSSYPFLCPIHVELSYVFIPEMVRFRSQTCHLYKYVKATME
jgi:hypothetical protein